MLFSQKRKESFFNACRDIHLCFVPHEKNSFIPKAAQHKLLFGYSFALLALKIFSLLLLIFLPAGSLYSSAITRANIVQLTNAARQNAGLEAVTTNSLLNVAAQAKAEDMLINQYFAHTSPAGSTPWSWIKSVGYKYKLAGENLAVHYAESEEVQSAWMASPSHRANILNERFKEVGVGIVAGTFEDFETILVVQMFGEPIATEPEPTVIEESIPLAIESNSIAPELPVTNLELIESVPSPTEQAPSVLAEFVAEQPVIVNPVESSVGQSVQTANDVNDGTPPQGTSPIESVVILPQKETSAYRVVVKAPDATQVNIMRGGSIVPLKPSLETSGAFEGELAYTPFGQSGDTVLASLVMSDGSYLTEPVAIFDEHTDTASFFAFQPPEHFKLFGIFKVKVIQDGIAAIYAIAVIFICALLLLTVLVHFERQHHSITAHLLIVLILTSILIAL